MIFGFHTELPLSRRTAGPDPDPDPRPYTRRDAYDRRRRPAAADRRAAAEVRGSACGFRVNSH